MCGESFSILVCQTGGKLIKCQLEKAPGPPDPENNKLWKINNGWKIHTIQLWVFGA